MTLRLESVSMWLKAAGRWLAKRVRNVEDWGPGAKMAFGRTRESLSV